MRSKARWVRLLGQLADSLTCGGNGKGNHEDGKIEIVGGFERGEVRGRGRPTIEENGEQKVR
jgi:hypothetical protein